MGRSHWLGAWVTSALLGAACSAPEDDRPPPAEWSEEDLRDTHLTNYDPSTGDARDLVAVGGCEDGATQSCRVYLAEHNGVQPCFVGIQTCTGSAWGSCGNAVLVDANADDAEIEADEATQ